MANITEFMTEQEAAAYGKAASIAAALEQDRAAWVAGVSAISAAKARAIAQFKGEVKVNRCGQPVGGVHPALRGVSILSISGCYTSE